MTSRKRSSTRNSRTRSSSRRSTQRSGRRRQSHPGVQLSRHQWVIIVGIILIAIAGTAILSGLSISQGTLTQWMWDSVIWPLFGYGGVVAPPVIGLVGLYLVLWGMEQLPQIHWNRVAGAGVLFLGVEGVLHLFYLSRHPGIAVFQMGALQEGGGYLGGVLVSVLQAAAGRLGAMLLSLALACIGLVMVSGVPVARLGQTTRAGISRLFAGRERPVVESRPAQELPASSPVRERPAKEEARVEVEEPPPVDTSQPGLFYGDAVRMAAANYSWTRPAVGNTLELGTESSAADAQVREQVQIIEHTLRSFGAPARVVEVNHGPVITQFGVEPQYMEQRSGRRIKVKVGQINSLANDLALALAAQAIRIEAPVPGKGYVGIEVPNAEASVVSLRDVMESKLFVKIKSPLRMGLGQDVSGHAIAADLTQMPHLLIAGATGAGKSVCINSIVACLLLNNTPDHLRLLMVDPKRVELTSYNGIPHLLTPVIVDLDKVVGALQWITREMDGRYRKFAEMGARNIADYNRQEDEDKLPYIVVVIDELADLMMMAPDETERTICRLAQMARATGIHLVIATQRPSVNVVTGLIKANFPARIAFAVASSTDSRVILDTTGAERLLGRGDMLFMSPQTAQPQRMQGCFVSDKELRKLVDFWRRQRVAAVLAGKAAREKKVGERGRPQDPLPEDGTPAEPAPPPVQQPLWEEIIRMEKGALEQGELLDEAIAIVRGLGKASVSLLQRRLRIGYTRAARLIDEMEAQGIVGPHPGGSRQRKVLPLPEKPAET